MCFSLRMQMSQRLPVQLEVGPSVCPSSCFLGNGSLQRWEGSLACLPWLPEASADANTVPDTQGAGVYPC